MKFKVHTFRKVACEHLASIRKLNIKRLFKFSDGCGQRYKSRGPLSDISYALSNFEYPIVHNNFGSRHGKGASDGESAIIKSHASTAVKAGKAVMKDAYELYIYCRDNLTKDASDDTCSHY
ncbi:hypothetical protein HOLleu_11113 [Holothuria leucospilota]|uniref:Uncharacterized protein n=1 Tax=Holothuria leucospilota TaxID=206669 RepID=A0A9Q1CFN4_HOLLE|nr:hypothetical protein HOLleu_11113 [Holothuria leucospilota]